MAEATSIEEKAKIYSLSFQLDDGTSKQVVRNLSAKRIKEEVLKLPFEKLSSLQIATVGSSQKKKSTDPNSKESYLQFIIEIIHQKQYPLLTNQTNWIRLAQVFLSAHSKGKLQWLWLGSERCSRSIKIYLDIPRILEENSLYIQVKNAILASLREGKLNRYSQMPLQRWRIDSNIPAIYICLIVDPLTHHIRGYVGKMTKLKYRWSTTKSTTIDTHLRPVGKLLGMELLSIDQAKELEKATKASLAELAIAASIACRVNSKREEDGGCWLFILEEVEKNEHMDEREDHWMHTLDTIQPTGYNSPQKNKKQCLCKSCETKKKTYQYQ